MSVDLFADIAAVENGAMPGLGDIVPPRDFERRYFGSSGTAVPARREKGREVLLAEFRAALEAERSARAPFLSDLAPRSAPYGGLVELPEFDFRYAEPADSDISRPLSGLGEWEKARVPDYRGPAGEQGRWTGYYRAEFDCGEPGSDRILLRFAAVDYAAEVYLNGRRVGGHEGFFSPFEFDITEYVRRRNILLVEIRNDIPTLGAGGGSPLDGDKIYAATGPGWDDPELGWHHCPAGAGICGRVTVERRPAAYISDIFVRPDVDKGRAELWLELVNPGKGLLRGASLRLDVGSRNFSGEELEPLSFAAPALGPGVNYCRFPFDMGRFRLWDTEEPWLYAASVELEAEGLARRIARCDFGMRKFAMDESSEPKGALYLNNKRVFLRGANEMGHLQRCAMSGDYRQLVDDILIARLANINIIRVTQRPVQSEVYDYFDMLGMMHQCDLPLFGMLRRNQFCEAVRQAAEMEKHVRRHPSTAMASLINESFPIDKDKGSRRSPKSNVYDNGHRDLYRWELEAFFRAARAAISIQNPDRVVKNSEGDYDPPTLEGLSDFHCYDLWYTNHMLPFGRLYKGFLPEIKEGWMTGCGEYGIEGLDNLELMRARYPGSWLPREERERWMPDGIASAQTYSMHGDWYEEQATIRDWIRESQTHQARGVALMTEALRRRSDLVTSTTVHLLIDAWPAGWMKTLVGVDRVPKPAYFSLRDSLKPLRLCLRCDRWSAYEGDRIEIEAWALNDRPGPFPGCRIVATLRDDSRDYLSFAAAADIGASKSDLVGIIRFPVPSVAHRARLRVDAVLYSSSGDELDDCGFSFDAYAREPRSSPDSLACADGRAEGILDFLGIEPRRFDRTGAAPETLALAPCEDEPEAMSAAASVLSGGGRVVAFLDGPGSGRFEACGASVHAEPLPTGLTFAAADRADPALSFLEAGDLGYLYDGDQGEIGFIATKRLSGEGLVPLVFTYDKKQAGAERGSPKRRIPLVARLGVGKGELLASSLLLDGRVGGNPALDGLARSLLLGPRQSSRGAFRP